MGKSQALSTPSSRALRNAVRISVNMENGDLGGAVVINAPSSPHTVELERVFALRAIYNGMTCDSAINWVVAPTL